MPVSITRTTRQPAARFLLLAGLALCWSAEDVRAEPADTLGGRLPVGSGMKCYSRTFDKGHMAAHPKQRITTMALVIAPMKLQGYDRYRVWPYVFLTRLKGEKGLFWQGGQCEFEGGELNCSVDCDGGHVTLAAPEAGPGLHLELSKNYILQGGCSDSRKPVVLSSRTEEPAYVLDAGDMKMCRSQFRASRKASEVLREIGRTR